MFRKLLTVSLILGTTLLLGCSSDSGFGPVTSSDSGFGTVTSSDSVSGPVMSSGNDTDNITPAQFKENIHSSLPDTWVTEYNTIKGKLLTILPLYQKYYRDIVVYAGIAMLMILIQGSREVLKYPLKIMTKSFKDWL